MVRLFAEDFSVPSGAGPVRARLGGVAWTTVLVALVSLVVMGLGSGAAKAAGAARDLTVEFRQLDPDQAEPGQYSAGSSDTANQWEPQMLQVRNGEKAQLRLNDAVPMQWVQSVKSQSSSVNAAASSASASVSNSGGSVSNALTWFDAGQSLSVEVNWNPNKAYAVLKIEVQHAGFDARVGGDLPRQSRATVSTTVTTPLAEWVTVAASGGEGGDAGSSGTYRSDRGKHKRRLLQVRVMAL